MMAKLLGDLWYWLRGALQSLWFFSTPRLYRGGAKAPVVLLPGWLCRWGVMKQVGDALSAAGHPVHTVPGLGYNRKSLPDSAALLDKMLRGRGLKNAALVGFSKGGLIGKYYLMKMNGEGRVAGLVSIATPYAGSRAGRRFFGSAHGLEQGAPAVAELQADPKPNARIVCILASDDIHAGPAAEAKLEGATNIIIPVTGHTKIMFDPRTRDVAVAAAEELQRLAYVELQGNTGP